MKTKGFTFAELLVVLVIMAALVCIAAPYATQTNNSQKLKQESLNIAITFDFLIDEAINTGRAAKFTLNSNKKTYWLEIAAKENFQQFVPLEGYLGLPHRLGSDLFIIETTGFDSDMKNEFLVFDPARPWPSASITLANKYEAAAIRIEGAHVEMINSQSAYQN